MALAEHELAFYSTAAQVLPVLIIVAIVELRYLPARAEQYPGPIRRRFIMWSTGLAMVTEFLLLLSLATNNGGPVVSFIAMAALTLATGMVFIAPVIAIDQARNRMSDKAAQDERNQI